MKSFRGIPRPDRPEAMALVRDIPSYIPPCVLCGNPAQHVVRPPESMMGIQHWCSPCLRMLMVQIADRLDQEQKEQTR